jgi:hypothetical protein
MSFASSLANLGGFTTPTPVAIGTRSAPNWGATFLGDLFNNERFLASLYEEIFNQYAFVSSGLITRDANLDVTQGGVSTTLPLVVPFKATEEVIQSNATWGSSGAGYLTPQKVNAKTQVYPVIHRGFLVAGDDLSRLGSGIDPLGAARYYLATNLAAHKAAVLYSHLNAFFGSSGCLLANKLDATRQAAGTSTEANFASAANLTRAKAKLGERGRRLKFAAMHSDVAYYLETIGMLTFSTNDLSTGGNIAWGGGGVGVTETQVATFAGLTTIVDDSITPTTDATNGDKYPVYLFEPGAIKEGVQQPLRVEYGRNIASKQDEMSPDIHYSLGVPGLTYGGALGSPGNSTLATPGNWTLAYTEGARQVPIVKLMVNTPLAVNP